MSIQEQLGDWWNILKEEFSKQYMKKLATYLSIRRNSISIYPETEDVFRAYKLTQPKDVKIIIIGQDPYYNGTADGLAFSYKNGERSVHSSKQSLDIIWAEMERDVQFGLYLDFNFDLSWLASQGVFLLNTILTVARNKPNSHKGFGWENFTGKTIQYLLEDERPKVFMLWGNEAQSFFDKIIKYYNIIHNHLILKARHPAYDLRIMKDKVDFKPNFPETFSGCSHFSKSNEFLTSKGIEKIRW